MNVVPTEILREILSYIPEKDLRPARLVSRFFRNAATERYFHTFRVPKTFEDAASKLLHISRRPELARCVRHIIYAHQPLPPRLHRRSRSTELDEAELAELDAARGIGWSDSRGKQIAASGEYCDFAKVLEFALCSRMVNVREITTGWNGLREGHGGFAASEWPENVIVGGRDCNTNTHTHTRSRRYFDPAHGVREEDSLGAFNEIITAASRARTRLNKLSMPATYRGILTDNPEILWRCAPLLQNLTALSVYFSSTLPHSQNYSALHQDAEDGRIFKFLSSAPRLKYLALGLEWRPQKHDHDIVNHLDPVIPLHKIFGDEYVWAHLETFLFNGQPIHEEELLHFLARHAGTLKSLGLFRPHLRTGTWRGVLDFLKEQRLRELALVAPSEEHVHARIRSYVGWNDGDSRRRMVEYVLNGGKPFPLVEAEWREREPQGYMYYDNRVGSEFDDDDDYQFEYGFVGPLNDPYAVVG
ncbi:hypothetical protein RUND412_002135 [Rhizina undulata]